MNDSLAQQTAHKPAFADQLAAGGAERRQRDIERPAARAARSASGARKPRASREALRFCSSQRHGATLAPRTSDAQWLQSPIIFDRDLLRARRARAAALGPATFLLDRVAADLAERLVRGAAQVRARRRSRHAGRCGAPRACEQVGTIVAVDARRAELDRPSLTVAADWKRCRFATASLDLVVSALALQFVNDLPGTLVADPARAQARRTVPRGADRRRQVSTELREAFAAAEAEIEGGVSPRVAPFVDVRELGALLQRAGFALPVTDIDRLTVRYASPLALMHDLRRMGATNALIERRRTPLRRATLRRMMEIYGERFADADGRVRATFEIVWLSGWAPHESQQQPLAPGSAKLAARRCAGHAGDSGGREGWNDRT